MKIVKYQHSLSVMAEPMAPYSSEFDEVIPLMKASANTDIVSYNTVTHILNDNDSD